MLLSRFKIGKEIHVGLIENERARTIEGSVFYNTSRITLLAPCVPSKIIAVGLNYTDHARELRMKIPKEPLIFIKPSTSVIGPFEKILYPKCVKRLDYETELGVVIKKAARNVPIRSAKDYILGYTCLNDITARDLQKRDRQWTRAKSFDTFCPIGPYISTDIEPTNLDIRLYLNRKLKQASNTKNLIFKPDYLVSFISKICTLLPGDIIATGTPSGVGPMKAGDDVVVEIEGIGTLKNKVAEYKHA